MVPCALIGIVPLIEPAPGSDTGVACDIPPIRLDSTHQKQNKENDQDDAEDTNAAVTVAVAVTAEAATEATKQEDDEHDDKYQSERHNLSPVAGTQRKNQPSRTSSATPSELVRLHACGAKVERRSAHIG